METPLRISAVSLAVIATIAVGWFLNVAQPILIPIVLGALVAFLMHGISRELERIPFYSRIIPGWLRMTMTTVVMFVILMVGVGFFARNLEPVVRAVPEYADSLSLIVSTQAARFDYELELTWQSLDRVVFDNINLQSVIRYALNSVSYSAGYMALVFLYAILFLIERESISGKIAAIVPDENARKTVWHTIDLITEQIGTYFTTKTLINAVLGAVCWVIFLVFGIEFAAFFAVLTAVFNYIPYVGSWIAMALPMLFAIGKFGLGVEAVLLFAALCVAQFGVGYFWEPRLMGRSMNLSPVIVMVSLAAWAAIWGPIGAILSVILTSGIMTILSFFATTRPIAILLANTGEVPSIASRNAD
ncbi:AI-2E family transporter [Shimia abyssi]|uniref:Putative PurR-regulated permease PerM n=1 Tax=Shimia abyssi TaxID=1662395 RepID=A0A2P8F825_9RHOB|nr:AI-2E family transporter [Shimia abyssi]PSL17874.1 putative PurR-regulated permease PerM [Shimia abyssi]